ncbi:MAG: alpha/beta fold hydrolase [Phormidesmis sp.]
MREVNIPTRLGQISVSIDEHVNKTQPIVFMHGIFLDKTLWANYPSTLTGHTHIYIDMPAHGNSSNVGHDWHLSECPGMLIEVLDALDVEKCIVVGHSWGGMTALRTAQNHAKRFISIALFNTPFKATTGFRKLGFQSQKLLVIFQRFYAKQAAKSLYTQKILEAHPELSTQMQERLAARPAKELIRVLDAVILDAKDSTHLITELAIPTIAVVGESDYVGMMPKIKTMIVPGGHISPCEAPTETRAILVKLAKREY